MSGEFQPLPKPGLLHGVLQSKKVWVGYSLSHPREHTHTHTIDKVNPFIRKWLNSSRRPLSCVVSFTVPPALCREPLDKGKCSASIPRYYYNTATKMCEEFAYSGCGGSNNNFVSLQACTDVCGKGVQMWAGGSAWAACFTVHSLKMKSSEDDNFMRIFRLPNSIMGAFELPLRPTYWMEIGENSESLWGIGKRPNYAQLIYYQA